MLVGAGRIQGTRLISPMKGSSEGFKIIRIFKFKKSFFNALIICVLRKMFILVDYSNKHLGTYHCHRTPPP